MRLSPEIAQRFVDFFAGEIPSEHLLLLFGSRTDDSKKGGDIDLLVIVSDPTERDALKSRSGQIRPKLRELADDQRVDVVFATEQDLKEDPFLKTIKNVVRLN